MVYVDAVHYETDSRGNRYIAKIKWTNNLNEQATKTCSKQEMIEFVKKNPNCTKTKYWSRKSACDGYSWIVGEDVRAVEDSYLRTDSNNTKADNLGALPEF